MNQKNDHEDPVVLLLRQIRRQLDQLSEEITDMLENEHRRDKDNEDALARHDKEADGKR